VESLKREKVDLVFGIPGGATLPIYDALVGSGIRHVLARHEQCAAHMADGFARVSGRVGVAMATSGPGSTNLVTGIATAYLDSSPVVAITGQVPTTQLGSDAFQEVDTVGIFNPITKYVMQPRTLSDVPRAVKAAFYMASSGRTGPVVVDIPKDVQMAKGEPEFPDAITIRGYTPYIAPDLLAIERVATTLLKAAKPIILVGGGAVRSGCSPIVLAIAEHLSIPVATTLMGKGSISDDHPLSLGTIGMHGNYQANMTLTEADLILSVGVRFSDRSTMNASEFATDKIIIHLEIDPSEVDKNIKADQYVIGDLNTTARLLYETVLKKTRNLTESSWALRVKRIKEESEALLRKDTNDFLPPAILRKMRELLPPQAVVTTDVGQNQMWAQLHFKVFAPRTFITSGGLGTMGFGLPAAVGAKAFNPRVPILSIVGDGGFVMTCNALATSRTEGLPVIVCIFNNSMLGMVAQWQRMFYDRRYSAVQLESVPDMLQIAKAFGVEGIRVQSMDELEKAFRTALRSEVTTVIDIPVSPEEDVFPMVPLGGSLKDMVVKP